jgi:hypothetical protein
MKSHWFLGFSVWYTNNSGSLVEIKGNAVYSLTQESFLPGTVIRTLKRFYVTELTNKKHSSSSVEVYLNFVLKIDEGGVSDFKTENSEGGIYSLESREFVLGKWSLFIQTQQI